MAVVSDEAITEANDRLSLLLSANGTSTVIAMLCGRPRTGRSTMAAAVARELVDAGRYTRIKFVDEDDIGNNNNKATLIPHNRRMDRWACASASASASASALHRQEERVLLVLDNVDTLLLNGGAMAFVRFLQDSVREGVSVLLVSSHPDPWPSIGRRLKQTLANLVPQSQRVVIACEKDKKQQQNSKQTKTAKRRPKVGAAAAAAAAAADAADAAADAASSSAGTKDASDAVYADARWMMNLQLIASSVDGGKLLLGSEKQQQQQQHQREEDADRQTYEEDFHDSSTLLVDMLIDAMLELRHDNSHRWHI